MKNVMLCVISIHVCAFAGEDIVKNILCNKGNAIITKYDYIKSIEENKKKNNSLSIVNYNTKENRKKFQEMYPLSHSIIKMAGLDYQNLVTFETYCDKAKRLFTAYINFLCMPETSHVLSNFQEDINTVNGFFYQYRTSIQVALKKYKKYSENINVNEQQLSRECDNYLNTYLRLCDLNEILLSFVKEYIGKTIQYQIDFAIKMYSFLENNWGTPLEVPPQREESIHKVITDILQPQSIENLVLYKTYLELIRKFQRV